MHLILSNKQTFCSDNFPWKYGTRANAPTIYHVHGTVIAWWVNDKWERVSVVQLPADPKCANMLVILFIRNAWLPMITVSKATRSRSIYTLLVSVACMVMKTVLLTMQAVVHRFEKKADHWHSKPCHSGTENEIICATWLLSPHVSTRATHSTWIPFSRWCSFWYMLKWSVSTE